MTENDPSAHDPAAPRHPETGQQAAHGGWPSNPYGEQPAAPESGGTPQYSEPTYHAVTGADPSYAAQQQSANPWSAQGAAAGQTQPGQSQPGQSQQSVYPPPNPYAQLGTSAYPAPAPQPKRSGGKMLAGVALVALLVGGIAGGAVGYLTGGSSGGPVGNALDAPKPAQQTGNAPAGSVESVAQKLSPSVVELQVSGQQGAGEGSGFVISTDGYILTNNHVVEVAANGGQIQAVFQDGRKSAAKVVGRDPTTDIAVVKVDGVNNLTPVEIGRSDDLRVGQQVVAIGSPFELAGTVTSGIVSSLHRPVRAGGGQGGQETVMDAVQTDAAINPGNSGGPLSNMSGQVIGINSAIYSPQSASGGQGQGGSESGNVGIGFAIPIDQARRTADTIIKTGQAVQTYIGAQVTDAPQGGAQLGTITANSPAEKAGLKAGDVVTKIDDRTIDKADTLVAAIRTRAPDEKAKFTLADGRTVEVTLGGQPVPAN
ncbi:trypsin-like peptidase domain-containing protein [Amycolatopsis sp. OK19-0408]|uniref:Trypsin-like peptidase domain-containing protein n=1 Tax=Amycolatopsis iheyensis TaxID=2945988 RepID=A0A9X2NB82_9PSEU|nr:trypsin-like peptidase domain-containing protein [Amycolatopsis iheyensis]MCR6484068.1 trypsin-like peptidase domain-containing protein [Amycolatopsis iheyensis]